MALIQRRLNVDATSWRCIDVEPTLYKRHVPAGKFLSAENGDSDQPAQIWYLFHVAAHMDSVAAIFVTTLQRRCNDVMCLLGMRIEHMFVRSCIRFMGEVSRE